jgi:hypothetical protein
VSGRPTDSSGKRRRAGRCLGLEFDQHATAEAAAPVAAAAVVQLQARGYHGARNYIDQRGGQTRLTDTYAYVRRYRGPPQPWWVVQDKLTSKRRKTL